MNIYMQFWLTTSIFTRQKSLTPSPHLYIVKFSPKFDGFPKHHIKKRNCYDLTALPCTRSDNVPIRNSFIQNVYPLGSKWDTQNDQLYWTHWFLGFLMTSGSREHWSTCTLAFISGVTYPWMYWPWNCKSKVNVYYFLPSAYRVWWPKQQKCRK